MITRRELDGAIAECESAPTSYQNCAKLATFYTIRDHIAEPDTGHSYDAPQVDVKGDSDFMQAIQGKDMTEILHVMDELMDAVLITNPRLYQGVMRQIKGQV